MNNYILLPVILSPLRHYSFFVILSGAKNLLFLRIREVDPSSLGRALLRVTGVVIPECLYRESTSLLLQEHEMSIGASY